MIDLRKHGATVRHTPLVAVSKDLALELRCTDPEALARRLPAVLEETLSAAGEGVLRVMTSDGAAVIQIRVLLRRDGLGVVLAGERP